MQLRKNKLILLALMFACTNTLLYAGDKRQHRYGSTDGKPLYQDLPDLELYKDNPIIAKCPKNSGARVTMLYPSGRYSSVKPTYVGHKGKPNEDLPDNIRHAEWWFSPIVKNSIKKLPPIIAECSELFGRKYVPTVDVEIPAHVEFCYETPSDKNKKTQFYCK
jgi:hypothetical protein